MIITKKESKQLRYFARANYKSEVKGVESENGKVKRREFPCFDLAYDEAKADKGMVELSNIVLGGKPFDGSFADLMARLREILDTPEPEPKPRELTEWEKGTIACLSAGPECKREPLPKGPSIVQRIKDSDEGKAIVETAEAIAPIIVPGAVDAHAEITDYSPKTETLSVDVDARVPNTVHEVTLTAEVKSVEPDKGEAPTISDPHGELTGMVNPTIAPEEKTIVVTGSVIPERHDSGRDYSGLSEEAIAEAYKSVVGEAPGSMKPGVEVAVEESLEHLATHEPPPLEVAPGVENPTWSSGEENVKSLNAIHVEAAVEKIHKDFETALQGAKETGKPVITAVQEQSVHLDAASDGTHDYTTVVVPKKPTRAELNDLRIKCATMKLAKSYDEQPDMEIGEIIRRYPDAAMKLNDLYIADGIKPYTISEDAIRKAYPDEYDAAKGGSV